MLSVNFHLQAKKDGQGKTGISHRTSKIMCSKVTHLKEWTRNLNLKKNAYTKVYSNNNPKWKKCFFLISLFTNLKHVLLLHCGQFATVVDAWKPLQYVLLMYHLSQAILRLPPQSHISSRSRCHMMILSPSKRGESHKVSHLVSTVNVPELSNSIY
jgi:hypothetical protein